MLRHVRLRVKTTVPAGTRYLRGERTVQGVSNPRSQPLPRSSPGAMSRRPVKGSSTGITTRANPSLRLMVFEVWLVDKQPEKSIAGPRMLRSADGMRMAVSG